MYMRCFARGGAVGQNDVPRTGLLVDPVPDVLVGAAAAAWWRHNHPEYGWLALALIVAAADYTGSQTMSDAFRTASRRPISGPIVAIGWGVLTAHLFGFIPPHLDPFHHLTTFRRADDSS
jgi:hypothetical protein